ncbi:MAG: MraY family glycosyltransferase, partial [Patescibacteria group bacterium]
MMQLRKRPLSLIRYSHEILKPAVGILAANFLLILIQLVYLNLRFENLKNEVPIWYTMPWGTHQLGTKNDLFLILLMEVIITTLGIALIVFARKKYIRYGDTIIPSIVTLTNVMLSYSLFRIIQISLTGVKPLINPYYLELIIPFIASIGVANLIAPKFIEYAKEKGIVTDPSSHKHPAMILTKPSARGGGLVFVAALVITSLIFVGISKEMLGILVVSILLAGLGLADDYQNTHHNSKLKFLEKPWIRLAAMFCIAFLIVPFGIKIDFFNNPFNGIYQFPPILASFITVIWIVWLLNLLSWSNGVDGQYSGIIGIAGIVLALLALRFDVITPAYENYAKLGVITAGASLGILPYSWHPSKIMWGFGAVAAGLVLSSLSILVNAKITTSILILLIPFMDASVTIIRRIIPKK